MRILLSTVSSQTVLSTHHQNPRTQLLLFAPTLITSCMHLISIQETYDIKKNWGRDTSFLCSSFFVSPTPSTPSMDILLLE